MATLAERFNKLPVHLFAEIDRMKREALKNGRDVIDLGVGDPDTPTPEPIVEACVQALRKGSNHRYPYQVGSRNFRNSIARFVQRRYGVEIDPDSQIVPLIGSKEGLAHFPIAFVNPGDTVLAADPGYPAYLTGTALSGGAYYPLAMLKEHDYRLQLETIPEEVRKSAKLLFFNYPNNPTTADAELGDFRRIAEFCSRYDIIGAHDAAYQELYYDHAPPSFLQAMNGSSMGIEFHSLSKTFSMTGWRAGFAIGHPTLIGGLTRIKSNVDTGLFLAIQEAAAFALDHIEELTEPLKRLYRSRRDAVLSLINSAGFRSERPNATIYIWCETPGKMPSMDFARQLLDQERVVVTPGAGLGSSSEGFFRISLCDSEDRLQEAVRRMQRLAARV